MPNVIATYKDHTADKGTCVNQRYMYSHLCIPSFAGRDGGGGCKGQVPPGSAVPWEGGHRWSGVSAAGCLRAVKDAQPDLLLLLRTKHLATLHLCSYTQHLKSSHHTSLSGRVISPQQITASPDLWCDVIQRPGVGREGVSGRDCVGQMKVGGSQ